MSTLIPRIFASLFLVFSLAASAAERAEPEDVPLFSQAELDQMLAPVALYPDELLSQVLMAATYPLEVVEAARFSRANPSLKGQDAVRAAQDKPWDPSVKAMLAFPQILERMDQDLDWTRRLGDAFLAQQEQVMDTVQALRKRADEAGNLKETEHVQVVREERTIIVRNRYPDVVYVPYYDPTLIYGSWWWPDYQPVRWSPWTGYRYYAGYNGFFWGPSVVVGYGFFFGHYDWRDRYVRIVEAPPFYYRRPPPPRYRWEHEYRHRKGVPYRHQRVYDRYHDPRDPVPGRPPRDRRDDHDRDRGQYPPGGPRQDGDGPRGGDGRGDGRGPGGPGDGRGPGDGALPGDGQGPRQEPGPGAGPGTPEGAGPDAGVVPGTGTGTQPGEGRGPGDGGPRGRGPGAERPDGVDAREAAPVIGSDSRVPGARPERDEMPGMDREGRAGRDETGSFRREEPAAPVSRPVETPSPEAATPRYTPPQDVPRQREDRPAWTPPAPTESPRQEAPRREAPSYETPRYETPRYTPPPREERPSYTPPAREERPSYTPPAREERPSYTPPPREERPSYNTAPRETPSYSTQREQRPSYSPPPSYSAPRQERPSYSPPPSYSAPRQERPSYSAPRQERPSYSPPPSYSAPRQERPSYSPPPRQERPSYSPPPRSESAPQGSDESRPHRNRERPD